MKQELENKIENNEVWKRPDETQQERVGFLQSYQNNIKSEVEAQGNASTKTRLSSLR